MPEYDAAKDNVIYDPVIAHETQYTRLSVSLHSYDGKTPKLQISRERCERGEWTFSKLGRMDMTEFAAVARAAKVAFSSIQETE